MAVEICNGLAEEHQVTLFLLAPREDGEEGAYARMASQVSEKVTVRCIPRFGRSFFVAIGLKTLSPDIVHCHLGRAARIVGRLRGRFKTVATLHGDYKSKDYSRFDQLVCIAKWQTDDIPDTFGGGIATIPNFLDDRLEDERTRRDDDVLAALNIPLGARVIGSVGRFTCEKGFDVLISAFERMAGPKDYLILVGDGPDAEALRELAGDRVRFTGWVDQPSTVISVLDLFVLPSHHEAFGLALLEAMNLGCPVLAANAHGPSELLREIPEALVPCGDAKEMARAMRRLLDDPTALRERSEKSKKIAERYKRSHVLPQLTSLYETLRNVSA